MIEQLQENHRDTACGRETRRRHTTWWVFDDFDRNNA